MLLALLIIQSLDKRPWIYNSQIPSTGGLTALPSVIRRTLQLPAFDEDFLAILDKEIQVIDHYTLLVKTWLDQAPRILAYNVGWRLKTSKQRTPFTIPFNLCSLDSSVRARQLKRPANTNGLTETSCDLHQDTRLSTMCCFIQLPSTTGSRKFGHPRSPNSIDTFRDYNRKTTAKSRASPYRNS
jgi:hypothetical protein